jgi:hypothetical protein
MHMLNNIPGQSELPSYEVAYGPRKGHLLYLLSGSEASTRGWHSLSGADARRVG